MGHYYNPSIVTDNIIFNLDAGNIRSFSGSGNTAFDLLTGGIGGTLNNGVVFGTADGGSFNFDGTNDYIQVPVNYIPTGNEATFCIWNYGTTAQASSVFSAHTADEFRTINIHLPWNDSVVYWDAGFSGGTYDRVNTATLTNAQWQGWHHWTFTKSATTGIMQIYLDGVLNVSGTTKTRTMATPSQSFIGRFQISSPQYHIGRVGQFTIYNRFLSATEISKNFSATKKRYGL